MTMDKEDPNASRGEIVIRSGVKLKSLVRKSDASDGLVDLQYQPNHQVESEPHDSPHSFSKPDYYQWITGDKSEKLELADAFDQLQADEQLNANELKLPIVNYFVPLLMSTNSVLEIFKHTCKQQNFQIIELEGDSSTAVYKEPFSFKKLIFKCIPVLGDDDEDSVSAVRINLAVDESKGCRKITLKGLYGKSAVVKTFFKFFNRKLQNKVK